MLATGTEAPHPLQRRSSLASSSWLNHGNSRSVGSVSGNYLEVEIVRILFLDSLLKNPRAESVSESTQSRPSGEAMKSPVRRDAKWSGRGRVRDDERENSRLFPALSAGRADDQDGTIWNQILRGPSHAQL
jgi:hypothetical protein